MRYNPFINLTPPFMNLLPKDQFGCPYLLLAPMEGVGDRTFRRAVASVGGFDEAVRDFIRVPKNAHVKSLASVYEPNEIVPVPLAAQVMGSDPDLLSEMARELETRKAHRIDLNCGCPSNTVTGRGAGSSLLKDPSFIYEAASSIVKAVSIPVTAKLRSGFDDTSLFKENLLAAQESGIKYITLHPRTKKEGYAPPANWDLISEAKSILKIPVVGNGDILSVDDAARMIQETGCDALMIGRGSIINPFIFKEIKARHAGRIYRPTFEELSAYIRTYVSEIPLELQLRSKINKFKQFLGFLLKSNHRLLNLRDSILRSNFTSLEEMLRVLEPLIAANTKGKN